MMRKRYSRWPRSSIALVGALATFGAPSPGLAGSATGVATEWTQLANNAQLIDLLKSSGLQVENQITQITQLAEQIQNQLKIYQNMLQNTARLPQHIWGQVEDDLNQLRDIVNRARASRFRWGMRMISCGKDSRALRI
jgi:type IV secretion system protein TrbJ